MAKYVYVPAETGDAYALSVQADGSVLTDGDIFDAQAAVATPQLSRDLGYDSNAGFPVYMYPL